MTTIATPSPLGYPIAPHIEPAAKQSRLSIFFRLLLVIPAVIVLAFVAIAGFVVTFIAWVTILFLGRFPEGMFRFVAGVQRWSFRVQAYFYLMTDKYPPFSLDPNDAYPAQLLVEPAITGRNRLTTFFRILLAIPHYIIIGLLSYAARAIGFVCWLIGIFTGRLPDGLHNFLAGYLYWNIRIQAYTALLTDKYPPFSMGE